MPLGDKKALDHYRNRLLRRAEAIQRRLDEVTRAAREELVSINDEIHALDSTRETLEEDGKHRADILDRKSVRVTKKIKTVLIVEKNPNHTQSLITQIRFAGLKPIVAVTGEGGLKMAEECHPDLILFEVELPDMNGLRFVSEIRRNPEADQVPIVAMSVFPDLKARCLEHGCNDFLLKPVRMIDLIGRLKKFLH
jgi:CheY-like chemotaxis protein